ncbi:class I SAM-dependent methyltransferase [Aminobacter aganoensis]|uniref:SAM-dependent methyltransferase n=1 Tax=Aminobacter aganoensis TaxID=83264 RepID=A0A7X0FCB4_9HYPH|nr:MULTISPECIES: class I SAM-dependent methyltransferase [Aminobacter]KQU74468.1 methylase [Aminobacter sp. DSM 101952]MBB6357122.1 SAM-dependent methyltransferase [Aminobacter aganoensis]
MAELFDRYGPRYGEVVARSISFSGLGHDFFLVAKARLLAREVDVRGLRATGKPLGALDIGCGVGALHSHLTHVFDSLHGCDLSEASIDRARKDHPHNAYDLCMPARLPYADGSFDFAFASCVLHHVQPETWASFIDEMRRVVRPGGIACLIEHNPYNPLTRLAVLRCPFDEDAVLLNARKAKALFRDAGLSEITTQHFLLFPSDRPLASRLETALAAFPLGAQYACSGRV